MYKLIALALLLASPQLLAKDVKGSGHIVEEARNLADFTGIHSEGAWNLDVQIGPKTSLKLRGDDNILPLIESRIEKGKLYLRFKEGQNPSIDHDNFPRLTLTVPKLSSFSQEGVGKSIFRNLAGDAFTINYQGAGLLTANGKVDKLTVQAEGAGSLDLKNLQSRDATVSLQGVGSVNVYASNNLTVAVDGIGSLRYYGKPRSVNKSVSGIGSVQAGD